MVLVEMNIDGCCLGRDCTDLLYMCVPEPWVKVNHAQGWVRAKSVLLEATEYLRSVSSVKDDAVS